MHNVYRGGTPDVWYSGPSGDLWVEYKWVEKFPKAGLVKPALSPLQLDWLTKRRAEGRNVLLVVGSKAGALALGMPKSWAHYDYIGESLHSDKRVAEIIEGRCS